MLAKQFYTIALKHQPIISIIISSAMLTCLCVIKDTEVLPFIVGFLLDLGLDLSTDLFWTTGSFGWGSCLAFLLLQNFPTALF